MITNESKVLLFTHSQDIDGAGCAILAKEAFSEVDVVPTKTFMITKNVSDYIKREEIFKYDKILVTDLCIKEPVLSMINEDKDLRNKVIVIDHHKTEIEEGNDKYDFVNIIVEHEGKKESGTSLFYHYLRVNGLIEDRPIIRELVEWTRQYDVYDWYKIKNYEAQKLHILFEMLGYDKYMKIMRKKIKSDEKISFNLEEEMVVRKYKSMCDKDIKRALEEMIVKDIRVGDEIFRIGYIVIPYKYRNDANEYVKENNKFDIEALGMIMTDIDTVSYRQVKDVDVSIVAKYFGGKGHRTASSNPQDNGEFKRVLKKEE